MKKINFNPKPLPNVKEPVAAKMSARTLAWYLQKRRKQRLIEDYQEEDDSIAPGVVDEGGPI